MATGTLTSTTIAARYKSLLKLTGTANDVLAADASAKYVEDGDGNDSVLSLSTTRVGIGNTAPTALLTAGAITTLVTDGTTAVTPEGVNVHITEASKYAMGIKNADASGDGLIIQAGDAADDFALRVEDYDSANDLLVVQGGGAVGIGTDAPAGLMEISSTSGHVISYITAKADATYTPQIQFRTGATPSTKFSMGVEAVGHADAGKFKIASQAGMIGTSEFVIDSSGNVGIGTASPSSYDGEADNLVVGTGTGHNGITILAGNTSKSKIHFADGTSAAAYDGMLYYDHNTRGMSLVTSANERMTIDSSGNVGIGASTLPWQSGWTALRLGGNTHITSITATQANSAFYLVHNAQKDTDSSFEYISEDEATSYSQGDGRHIFAYAGSGEATTDITFIDSFTLDNDGDVKVLVGDLIFGTAGKGIVLGATSNTDANTLDDYEEGSYTATISESGGQTPTAAAGSSKLSYTKIGRLVTVVGTIQIDNIDSGSGALQISLPFTPKANDVGTGYHASYVGTYDVDIAGDGEAVYAQINPGTAATSLYAVRDGATAVAQIATGYYRMVVTFEV